MKFVVLVLVSLLCSSNSLLVFNYVFVLYILCTVEEAQMGFYLARKELFLLSG